MVKDNRVHLISIVKEAKRIYEGKHSDISGKLAKLI